jgi:ligand-binding sensor domain-containing protein
MPTRIFPILLFVFVWGAVAAQPTLTLPPYRQYTMRDGLSQMQVTCMLQDSRGYLWIGTKGGLNCFNGRKFSRIVSREHSFTTNEFVLDIVEDAFGRVWASTLNGVVMIDGDIQKYFVSSSIKESQLAADDKGRVWYISQIRTSSSNHFGYFEDDKIISLDKVISDNVYFPWVDIAWSKGDKAVIIALDKSLYQFRDEKIEKIPWILSANHFISGNEGQVYFSDFEDKFNLSVYEVVNKEVVEVVRVVDGNYSMPVKINDTLFLISNSYPITGVGVTPGRILYDFDHGIPLNFILNDRDNHLWIGSEDGLYQIFDNGFVAYDKTALPQIWAVIEDQNGSMWYSSYHFGLFRQRNNKLTHYPNNFENRMANPYFHPSIDKTGRLFFPNAYGILVVDGDRFQKFHDHYFLTTFYDLENQLLWAGGMMRAVVFDQQMKKVRVVDKEKQLDVGTNVLTISKDSAGFFWLGGGSGLARYDWKSDTLKNYQLAGQANGALTSCIDNRGRIWFGCKQGLFWYDAIADSLVRIERDELSDAVNMVTTIDTTWLLASQPYGIYLMDLQKYYQSGEVVLHLFNEKNGFTGIEPGQDGAYTDSRGHIWMTTSTEVVRLNPEKLKAGKHSLFIRLDKVNGLKMPFTSDRIELKRNQNNAILNFDAVCYSCPNPEEYSWKLGTGNWSSWQEEDYAILSGLPDGQNNISIRVRVKGLPLSAPVQLDLPLFVRMAFYRQPWFWPAVFSFLTFSGILILLLAWFRVKKADRESKVFQVQAIQSQMNPHFIFNVLASLQSKILNNNIQQANYYLVRMAGLIRGFLDASANTGMILKSDDQSGQVTLEQELKMIEEFVELQQMIFPGKFDYQVEFDGVDCEREYVPPMLMQPFVENSIRHGLLPRDTKGLLKIEIRKSNTGLHLEISDNGVGVRKAKDLKAASGFRYISRGRELTLRRIELLNKLGFKISFSTESNDKGTVINIIILR